jgi:hypothetical protein
MSAWRWPTWGDRIEEGALEDMMKEVMVELKQQPSLGEKWFEAAGALWIQTVEVATIALTEHEKDPSVGETAWKNLIKLLTDVGVPTPAHPIVEAKLRSKLRPSKPSSGTNDEGAPAPAPAAPAAAPAPATAKRSINEALVAIDPLPFTAKGPAQIQIDESNAAKFWNSEHLHIWRACGYTDPSVQARCSMVNDRWNMAYKVPDAALKQYDKPGGLRVKVTNFFKKPMGAAAIGWKVPDAQLASSRSGAEELLGNVTSAITNANNAVAKLPAQREAAEKSRRVKMFDVVKLPKHSAEKLTFKENPLIFGLKATHEGKRMTGSDTHLQELVATADKKWADVLEKLKPLQEQLRDFLATPIVTEPEPPTEMEVDAESAFDNSGLVEEGEDLGEDDAEGGEDGAVEK